MKPNNGDKTVATILIYVGIKKYLYVLIILLSNISAIAMGIIGVSAKPRILHKMFIPRRFTLPLSVKIVPASDSIITTVRNIVTKNGFCD